MYSPNARTMERTLDFSDVLGYDFSMTGPDMLLKLFQSDVTTNIKIVINKTEAAIVNDSKQNKSKINTRAKMTPEKVREIRSNWDQTVKACGTKTAAAERLAKIYGCSSKNIYAIIYKYSWVGV